MHRLGPGFGCAAPGMTEVEATVTYAVYMLASQRNGTLYIGVTNDLGRRVYEHKSKRYIGFTSTYGVTRLVWYEHYDQIDDAIAREKKLKKMASGVEARADRRNESDVARS